MRQARDQPTKAVFPARIRTNIVSIMIVADWNGTMEVSESEVPVFVYAEVT
jgi:hypothetical protein